ncbi:fluoride efflux transporter CrcB [Bacillus piscicola]|uniref:fluoride efflux transporter CrcB n=1 Tax=Bacillus piscicola TaxID=1632684 RepID=UPI001F08986F|nr:fluoride efflux transporter CrcB [Bacillus piscicola]
MIGVYIAVGGAAGAVCRYLLGRFVARFQAGIPIPISMLVVNVLGSFGLGVLVGTLYGGMSADASTEPLYLLVGTGFFGAFTTFSTFSLEIMQLLHYKKIQLVVYYVMLSYVGITLSFYIGLSAVV